MVQGQQQEQAAYFYFFNSAIGKLL